MFQSSSIVLFAAVLCWAAVGSTFAGQSSLPCSLLLEGCGQYSGSSQQIQCCSCFPYLNEDCDILVGIFCDAYEDEEPLCCACETSRYLSSETQTSESPNSGTSELSDNDPKTSPFADCANPDDEATARRLIREIANLSIATLERCGFPVSDECAGEEVTSRLACMTSVLHEAVADIREACGI